MLKQFNVIFSKWGTAYGPKYINNLYSMIKRDTSYSINFYCFIDDSKGLDKKNIVKKSLLENTVQKYKTKYSRDYIIKFLYKEKFLIYGYNIKLSIRFKYKILPEINILEKELK